MVNLKNFFYCIHQYHVHIDGICMQRSTITLISKTSASPESDGVCMVHMRRICRGIVMNEISRLFWTTMTSRASEILNMNGIPDIPSLIHTGGLMEKFG